MKFPSDYDLLQAGVNLPKWRNATISGVRQNGSLPLHKQGPQNSCPAGLAKNAPSELACSLLTKGGLIGLPLRVSNEGLPRPRVARAQETIRLPSHLLPSSLVLSQGWGLIDLPLRAAFSPAHPLARPETCHYPEGSATARCASTEDHQAPSPPLFREHRINVGVLPSFSPCAFCEQEGRPGCCLSSPIQTAVM